LSIVCCSILFSSFKVLPLLNTLLSANAINYIVVTIFECFRAAFPARSSSTRDTIQQDCYGGKSD
jgi:hypothetical protein